MNALKALVGKILIVLNFAAAFLKFKITPTKNTEISFIVEEFFHEKLRGFGGFGMTVKNISDYYNTRDNDININVILSSQLADSAKSEIQHYHNANVLLRPYQMAHPTQDMCQYISLLAKFNSRMFVTIDFYPSYNFPLKASPWTPVMIYIRDPRGKEEWSRLASVDLEKKQRLNEGEDSLEKFTREKQKAILELIEISKKHNRKIIFATNAQFLVDRARKTYGIEWIKPHLLQNPLPMVKLDTIEYSKKPSLCVIGRLDAQKRFWIAFELSKRFPHVDFLICGDTNNPEIFDPIINKYKSVGNLKMLGVVQGEQKHKVLKECWGLLNTSIHEGLPVTFLETFMYGKTVISCLDPDNLVTRFGYYTGDILGDGMEEKSLDMFSEQIEKFLKHPKEHQDKGRQARAYIEKNHTFQNFDRQFHDILKKEGIK